MENKENTTDIGVQGWLLYEEGEYEKAEPILRKAIEEGDVRFIGSYATICGSQERWREEARALMMGALFGDGDLYSYVSSISKALVEQLTRENLEERAEQLTTLLGKQREHNRAFLAGEIQWED